MASAIRRSGARRSASRSDHLPTAIRTPIPETWIAASETPAAT